MPVWRRWSWPTPVYAEYIDQVEVGSRVAGHLRVAFEVDESDAVTTRLASAGADVIARPTRTPWNSLNARLAAPAGLQVTIFAELGESRGVPKEGDGPEHG
jgi:lactoylglutathione lyase